MEDKYYTPQFEEFRVGFEYEAKDIQSLSEELTNGMTYSKEIFDSTCNILGTKQALERQEIRVKLLDKTDIESLGFEPSFDEPEEWFHSYKGNSEIQLYFDDKIKNKNKGIGISIYNDVLVFSGYVKNKSELETLLKQVL